MSEDAKRFEEARKARARALRAARVVTLGLALAGGGCYAQHGATPPIDDDAPVVGDAGRATSDLGAPDLGLDAGAPDVGLDQGVADAGAACAIDESWSECCERVGWACDEENSWGCCAWGPYLPPGDDAMPESRARV